MTVHFPTMLRRVILMVTACVALLGGPAAADTWTTYAYPNDLRDITRVDQVLWMATTGGALKYDLATGQFEQITRKASGGPLSQLLTCVTWEDRDKLLFFGSADFGVSQYEPDADRWSRFEFVPAS